MSTPQDGLANVVAYVSFTIAGAALTLVDSFQVAGNGAGAAVGVTPNFFGISRISAGVVDVAIDPGKGAGPTTPASSLQAEFEVATTGSLANGTVPMVWTVAEGAASTATNRIYRFQFFNFTVASPAVGSVLDPAQCTITIRRKKPLPGSV